MRKSERPLLIQACPICFHVLEKENPILLSVTSLYTCGGCGVVFASPNFQNEQGDFFDAYHVKQWLSYYKPFRRRAHKFFLSRYTRLFSSVRSVLDVGCAAGWFLDSIKKVGVRTVGIEPSLSIEKLSKSHELYRIPAKDMVMVKGKFELISFWNVFEHFSNPHRILKLASSKLKPSGLLILSIPNQDGFISRIAYALVKISSGFIRTPLEELFQTNNSFGHLFHYHRRSLEELLKMHAFKPLIWEGADIVDVSNVRQRLRITTNHADEAKQRIVATIVALMTRVARCIKMQDELVVIARKI